MPFPETRHTLIRRIASNNAEPGWNEFLADYWEPVRGFAARRGGLSAEDADDVAATTFEVLLRKDLLADWIRERPSKLRTLLCGIARNVVANHTSKAVRRSRLEDQRRVSLDSDALLVPASDEDLDAFYRGWVEHQLRACIEQLRDSYFSRGRGDYFRVLYGRTCEEMSTAEVADVLGLKTTDVENFYKHAKNRLRTALETQVRVHAERYEVSADVEGAFRRDWDELGAWLERNGGLERVLRAVAAEDRTAHGGS